MLFSLSTNSRCLKWFYNGLHLKDIELENTVNEIAYKVISLINKTHTKRHIFKLKNSVVSGSSLSYYTFCVLLFYVFFKYFSSYNNIYLFQSHAENKQIYNENCAGFYEHCNGACWSLLVIGRKKKKTGVMIETHLSLFHSALNHARRKRSRNSVSSVARYAFNSLF